MIREKHILLAFLALATAASAAETKNVDRTLQLGANGSVTLDSHNGSIHVHTWDRPEIEIHARIEAGGSSAEDLRRFRDTTVEIDASSGSVHIKSKMPDGGSIGWSGWWFTGSSPEIHYNITAPRTARWTIRDHNSTSEIRDVSAALDIDTHNGSLRVVNLNGRLELRMHNGSANIDFGSFTQPSLVDMHNGSVELTLPASSKFTLQSDGHNNAVHSDFAVMAHMSGRRAALNGPVNGGGPTLRLESHNGHFRLHSK